MLMLMDQEVFVIFITIQHWQPPIIDIEKITTHNDKLSRIVLEQGIALKHNDSVFYDIHTQCVSGWKNPYLCV